MSDPTPLPSNPRQLSAPEQMLLGATRLWVSKSAAPSEAYVQTSRYFALFGMEHAARSHATVMHNIVVAATCKLRINGLCAAELTRDEARIAHAVGHAQADRMIAARREFFDDHYAEDVHGLLMAGAALATAMARRGLMLEVRPWITRPSAPAAGRSAAFGRPAAMAPPTSSLVH